MLLHFSLGVIYITFIIFNINYNDSENNKKEFC